MSMLHLHTHSPEKAPRLFDLVRISDPALAPAFYFALRDTLVANDINQATRIAYGATRYRVVTLGGDMVELSGGCEGGGERWVILYLCAQLWCYLVSWTQWVLFSHNSIHHDLI